MTSKAYGIGVPEWNGNVKKFIKAKLEVLKEFGITPTASEMVRLYQGKSEVEINNICQSIMDHHWG